MGSTQRVINAPHSGCPDLLTPPAQTVFIQPKLEENGSGLAKVMLRPCAEMRAKAGALDQDHSAAAWMHRCAFMAGVHPYYPMVHCQREQGLIKNPAVLDWIYKVTVVYGPRPALAEGSPMHIVSTLPEEGRERWCLVSGVWKMVAACGVGIADRGAPPFSNAERHLGFDRQVWGAARSGAS